jgi:hypothetical protein
MTSAGPTPTPPYLVRAQELPRVRCSLAVSNDATCRAHARTEPTQATRQLASGTLVPQTPVARVQHAQERTAAGSTWRAPAGCLGEARGACTWSALEPPAGRVAVQEWPLEGRLHEFGRLAPASPGSALL